VSIVSAHFRSLLLAGNDTVPISVWRGEVLGTKVCRYNRHTAGSLGWPFPMLKLEFIFRIKLTEAISSNGTRKLLPFEITKIPTAVN